jgi:hypothetical protein
MSTRASLNLSRHAHRAVTAGVSPAVTRDGEGVPCRLRCLPVLALLVLGSVTLSAAGRLQNDRLLAEFGPRGLRSIHDRATGRDLRFVQDGFAIQVDNESLDSVPLRPTVAQTTDTGRVYTFRAAPWTVKVVYELEPGWRFVSKQLFLTRSDHRPFFIHRVEPLRGQILEQPVEAQRLRSATLLRFARDRRNQARYGSCFLLQNPFLQWHREGRRISMAYAPEMDSGPGDGAFTADRVCIGSYALSGARYPTKMVPEWKLGPAPTPVVGSSIDVAEEEALMGCARAFLLFHRSRTLRVHVGWCENDYQIDVAAPEGRREYERIINQAAALGCSNLLFAPANSALSSVAENRDAWGWENVLWFGLGQRIRKGQWDPATDPMPASVQALLDYARGKGVGFLAYVYPSLPFLQNPAWTKWVKGTPGGYQGADTGLRSFQDWLLDKLVAFHNEAGNSGYSFDHWFIDYDHASSKYAQWDGCRRVLDSLRKRIPDVVIDGRQQYQYFGVWTWLAGSYPHPLSTDEQPQSFRAFPDLHLDRVSADRQRYTAWWYRMTQFCPPELLPGFITHQTPRNDADGVMHRDRFRARDWDYLGWRYSLISAIGTAPFNHVVNMIPARDVAEYTHFAAADKKWFRGWLDWTDRNIEVLRHVRPILGQPMIGHVDGTAAFEGDHGFVFLFNPNYRPLPARFRLDASIGLTRGRQFLLRQLYPDPEQGRLLAGGEGGFWRYGDTVSLPMPGTDALVLAVGPAPKRLTEPLLFNVVGHAALVRHQLRLTDVKGEAGTLQQVEVRLPSRRRVAEVTANGVPVRFNRSGAMVSARIHFAGARFARCQQIGAYDPSFAGGVYRSRITIPSRVFDQLKRRRRQWPIPYTADDLRATWLGPDRLLLFVNVAEPSDKMRVALRIDGRPARLKRAYSSIYPQVVERTFVGWYADVSSLQSDAPHTFEVALPTLVSGQFQGLFLDNVEARFTRRVAGDGSAK